MIAIDARSFIAYLEGAPGEDVEAVEAALAQKQACLPPATLTELFSDPGLPATVSTLLRRLPLLPLTEGYWERAGALRAKVLAKGHKARLVDVLIAQSCLDHDLALIQRDRDYRAIARLSGLRLWP